MSYFEKLYKTHHFKTPSSFAKFCAPEIKSKMIELGCGDCRDLYYFKKIGIKCNGVDLAYNSVDVETIVDNPSINKCPDYVYTRFFWHSISRKLQLKILKWVKNYLFIEARTTEDVSLYLFGKHKRYLVNVARLVKDLKNDNFQILYLHEGRGLSILNGEDPHLCRIIAKKVIN